MRGIDLNKPIIYKYASLRFFSDGEYHVERYCTDNVLLVVYDGVLRFCEDGCEHEIGSGEYYVQRKNAYQSATSPSDAPKYLYVHFDGDWSDGDAVLATRGRFDIPALSELMRSIDAAAHSSATYTDCQLLFLKLILTLSEREERSPMADRLARYVEENIDSICSLDDLCRELHYSKNYVIRIFKRELGMSPFEYIGAVKLKRATYLIETTSEKIDAISKECGYPSYSHFYRIFTEKNGMSPSSWRKRVRKYPIFAT